MSLDGILFCHGSPRSDEEIITAITPESRLAPMFEGVEEGTIVGGHTHHQYDRAVLGKRLLNAGSVGMPYEDEPAAYWLLLEDGEPSLRRTDYDIAAAVERLRATGFPDIDEIMLRESLLEPVGSAYVARHFEDGDATRRRAGGDRASLSRPGVGLTAMHWSDSRLGRPLSPSMHRRPIGRAARLVAPRARRVPARGRSASWPALVQAVLWIVVIAALIGAGLWARKTLKGGRRKREVEAAPPAVTYEDKVEAEMRKINEEMSRRRGS